MALFTPILVSGKMMPGAGVAGEVSVFSRPQKLRVTIVQVFAGGAVNAQRGLDLAAQFRNFGSPPAASSTAPTVSSFRWG
jgi:hypothetical protein